MASNFTENYGLCQWEATDQVLREEFNQDNIKIEQAILAASTSPSCVTGSYMGNGETITVELGFQPSFLVIIPTGYQTSYNTDIVGAFGFSGAMTRVNRNSSCRAVHHLHFHCHRIYRFWFQSECRRIGAPVCGILLTNVRKSPGKSPGISL